MDKKRLIATLLKWLSVGSRNPSPIALGEAENDRGAPYSSRSMTAPSQTS